MVSNVITPLIGAEVIEAVVTKGKELTYTTKTTSIRAGVVAERKMQDENKKLQKENVEAAKKLSASIEEKKKVKKALAEKTREIDKLDKKIKALEEANMKRILETPPAIGKPSKVIPAMKTESEDTTPPKAKRGAQRKETIEIHDSESESEAFKRSGKKANLKKRQKVTTHTSTTKAKQAADAKRKVTRKVSQESQSDEESQESEDESQESEDESQEYEESSDVHGASLSSDINEIMKSREFKRYLGKRKKYGRLEENSLSDDDRRALAEILQRKKSCPQQRPHQRPPQPFQRVRYNVEAGHARPQSLPNQNSYLKCPTTQHGTYISEVVYEGPPPSGYGSMEIDAEGYNGPNGYIFGYSGIADETYRQQRIVDEGYRQQRIADEAYHQQRSEAGNHHYYNYHNSSSSCSSNSSLDRHNYQRADLSPISRLGEFVHTVTPNPFANGMRHGNDRTYFSPHGTHPGSNFRMYH